MLPHKSVFSYTFFNFFFLAYNIYIPFISLIVEELVAYIIKL